ncbi:MAG: helix-turn-helix transcriptional regulator [Streptosporangiaceae bacterium]
MSSPDEVGGSWTLLTGHGHVLVEIARDPQARMRDISAVVGLTERTVQAIVADLEAAGYLTRGRIGRRNQYTVNPDTMFRHSAQEGLRVGPLLDLLAAADDGAATGPGSTADAGSSQPTEVPPPGKRTDRHEARPPGGRVRAALDRRVTRAH